MQKIKTNIKNRGYAIVYLIVIIFIFSAMLLPIINLLALKMKVVKGAINKEESLQIADAGINYYQWHLAHFPVDYKDGTTGSGPYVHDYFDTDTGKKIGQFSLLITPPDTGSTIVKIQSTGWTDENPNIKRTVTARYGIPSLAKYSFLSNSIVWIGSTESVSGEMQSNNGIRFDGSANAPIESAKTTYTCSANQGNPPCPTTKDGVWGSASATVKSFWKFPVPVVDFSSLTADLAGMKSSAQSAGIYLPPSGTNGYSLIFKSDGTVTVSKVTRMVSTPRNLKGWDINSVPHNEYIDYATLSPQFTQGIPANGIIFVEDKVWVEGIVKGKVIVAAAVLPYTPSTAPIIYIPKSITYLNKDGSNVLGLLAQKDVVVTHDAPTNLEIDAALIAQNGSIQTYYYPSLLKNKITIFGSVMSYGQWTWSYGDSSGHISSGYVNTSSTYDSNLLFSPPPSFPLSASGYQQMDWISN